MKTKLKNLNATLTYCLEAMYDAEKKIQSKLPGVSKSVSQNALRKIIDSYIEAAADKRTKLKRTFSYLLAGPFEHKSVVAKGIYSELKTISELTGPPLQRDLLVMQSLLTLSEYKSCTYKAAGDMAAHLGLDQVVTMLDEVIAWEKEVALGLKKLHQSTIGIIQKENLKSKAA